MRRLQRVFSFLLLAAGLSSCGHHLNERLPGLNGNKGAGAVTRSQAQDVELAIQKGDAAGLAALLSSGFPVNERLSTGLTPLLQAIVSTRPARFEAVFRLLVEKGADLAARDAEGNDALHLASSKRVARRLLQPDQSDALVRELFSRLEELTDRAAIVALFRDEGEDVNVLEAGSGETPLTLAVSMKRRGLFGALLEESLREELDLSKVNRNGKSPLRLARELDWRLAIAALEARGAKEE